MAFSRAARLITAVLTVAVMVLNVAVVPVASAGMIETEEVVEVVAERSTETQRAQIAAFLERDDVRAQLEAHGVTPEEAEARIAAMSERELAMFAGYVADDPAGEGLGTALAVLIGIAAFLFITDVLGVTNIYPFVRPMG